MLLEIVLKLCFKCFSLVPINRQTSSDSGVLRQYLGCMTVWLLNQFVQTENRHCQLQYLVHYLNNPLHEFFFIRPSVRRLTFRVCSVTLILFKIFHETWYKYKPPSDDMQRKRTVTPSTYSMEICPFEICTMKFVLVCIFCTELWHFEIFF